MATNFLSSSSFGKNFTFFSKAFLSSSSPRRLTSFSSSFLVRCFNENERLAMRNKANVRTLHKKVQTLLETNPDAAITYFDGWIAEKAKKVPSFEDGKTTREVVTMAEGAFVIYVCDKYLADPSEKKEKAGNKKKMKIKKPKKFFVKNMKTKKPKINFGKKKVGSSETTPGVETEKLAKKDVGSPETTPGVETEKLAKKDVRSPETTPDDEIEKLAKKNVETTPDVKEED